MDVYRSVTLASLASVWVGCLGASEARTSGSDREPPTCPAEMVGIAGAVFELGAGTRSAVTRVTLSPFCIDRTEVTVDAYARCVGTGACSEPDAQALACNWNRGRGDHPVNCVDWNQARSYCEFVGGRLPTEAEWEYAARGSDGRAYPWGETPPDDTRARWSGSCGVQGCSGGTGAVGLHPSGRSPFGLHDMAGNVFEWVADGYGPYPGGARTNPTGAEHASLRVLRGGGYFGTSADHLRASARMVDDLGTRAAVYGFRYARSPAGPTGARSGTEAGLRR